MLSEIVEKRLTESRMIIERIADILCEIKAIPVSSTMDIVYRSEIGEEV